MSWSNVRLFIQKFDLSASDCKLSGYRYKFRALSEGRGTKSKCFDFISEVKPAEVIWRLSKGGGELDQSGGRLGVTKTPRSPESWSSIGPCLLFRGQSASWFQWSGLKAAPSSPRRILWHVFLVAKAPRAQ